MQVQPSPNGWIQLRTSRSELTMLNNGLNEALEALDDWEFATRMGGTKDEVRQLLADIKAGLAGSPADSG